MLTRRKTLATLGFTGLALAASASPLKAAFFQKLGSNIDLADLPPEWCAHQGSLLGEYAAFLAGLKLTRITPRQVIESHAKEHQGVWNGIPPKVYWRQIVPTLQVVDRVAAELNMPLKELVSAYRSPAYNARCPGAKSSSWHQANVACDIVFPTSAYQVTAVTRNLRDRGLFKGGVGSYPGFTHVDTRGVNVNW
ncbi:hypothetical protein llg_22250 [Luteolibacter sp. LG18]|nr:hypothetical protein llg_22250 [Luteolibacter sp. LG18]